MKTKTQYVLGFLFNKAKTQVVLIEKKRPQWQTGLLNGVGGHIEEHETRCQAMSREFQEEAGVAVPMSVWHEYCNMAGSNFEVTCFMATDTALFNLAHTVSDERIVKVNLLELGRLPSISGLQWLIPMALDDNAGNSFYAVVRYGPQENPTAR